MANRPDEGHRGPHIGPLMAQNGPSAHHLSGNVHGLQGGSAPFWVILGGFWPPLAHRRPQRTILSHFDCLFCVPGPQHGHTISGDRIGLYLRWCPGHEPISRRIFIVGCGARWFASLPAAGCKPKSSGPKLCTRIFVDLSSNEDDVHDLGNRNVQLKQKLRRAGAKNAKLRMALQVCSCPTAHGVNT